MKIDWFTVIAQLVNFAILVLLLRRFLYRRVVEAMDARRAGIEAQLAAADAAKLEAVAEAEALRDERRELRQARDALLLAAREEAEVERRRLSDHAREEVAALRDQWEASLDRESAALTEELLTRARSGILEASRRALTELAGADLEGRMVEAFVHRLRALDEASRAALAAPSTAGEPAVVTTSAPLAPALQARVIAAARELLSPELHVVFEVAERRAAGIDLTLAGRRVAWGVEPWIEALEESLAATLAKDHQEEHGRAA
jgi:F-type H+-transporting ATPase subunit b